MTHFERLLTLSAATCCVCGRHLSIQELDEFYSATDDYLHGEVYCRSCTEEHLLLCRECSGCYTINGICEGCTTKVYGLTG
jgi:hypothetical protein